MPSPAFRYCRCYWLFGDPLEAFHHSWQHPTKAPPKQHVPYTGEWACKGNNMCELRYPSVSNKLTANVELGKR
jgi:hypothetical protein